MSPTKVSSVRIPEELLKKAKEKGLNLSQITTQALILIIEEGWDLNLGARLHCTTPVLQPKHNAMLNDRPVEPVGETLTSTLAPQPCSLPGIPVHELLNKFKEILEVDLNRSEATISSHLRETKRILAYMGSEPISKERIRSYLRTYRESPASTYNNVIKSLRVFFRELLNREDLVNGFKFRKDEGSPIQVPEKAEIQKFYHSLEDPLTSLYFLLLASSGLRRSEILGLTTKHISLERRMIIPGKQSSTKRTYVSFYSPEADKLLNYFLPGAGEEPILVHKKDYFNDRFLEASKRSGVKISPQILRDWFCSEMGSLGVPDRYVDAFCGRVPKSILGKRYTDFSPKKLQRIYEKAGLRVLE